MTNPLATVGVLCGLLAIVCLTRRQDTSGYLVFGLLCLVFFLTALFTPH